MCRSLVKFILFIVNLLFSIIGLALIGAGIAAVYELEVVTENIPIDLDFLPYAAISLGVIVFLIAFSGCCGAVTETKCLLITYAVCMAVLAAAKIVITIILFLNLENYKSTVQAVVNSTFEDADTNQNFTFHAIETLLQCCGTYGPDSYVTEYNLTAPTCCENPTNDTICTKEEAFQTGCTTVIGDYVTSFGNSFGYGLIIIFGFQLVAMTFSIYIIKTMELKYADDKYY